MTLLQQFQVHNQGILECTQCFRNRHNFEIVFIFDVKQVAIV
jgi:hypothetical protein